MPNRDEIKKAAEICTTKKYCTDCPLWESHGLKSYHECAAYAFRALLAYMEREEKNINVERFRDNPPCYLCGYNGPGYFQPEQHKCAAYYHAAIKAIEEGR